VLRRLVKVTRSGTVELKLSVTERELLRTLVPQLRALLVEESGDATSGPGDPSLARLFPTAVVDDAEQDLAFRSLVHDDLLAARLANLDVVEQTLVSSELEPAQVGVWMRTINELRLVIGTKLDVSEDTDWVDPDDPEAPLYAVYGWLGLLLEALVQAGTALPPDPDA
jgi:hypothetical protein